MSARRISAKKQHPIPQLVDFEAWKDRLKRYLAPRSPAGRAWRRWSESTAEYFNFLGDTDRAREDSLLEMAYSMTRPQLVSAIEKKKHHLAATKIKELLPALESTLGAVKACNSKVVPEDGMPPLVLSDLTRSFEDAVFYMREALMFLARPYGRSADVLSHCVIFLADLNSVKVSESDAVALTRLLMKAHGFSEDELIIFSETLRKGGTIRKRRHNAISNYMNVIDSQLESRSVRINRPPFNPAHYKQKQG